MRRVNLTLIVTPVLLSVLTLNGLSGCTAQAETAGTQSSTAQASAAQVSAPQTSAKVMLLKTPNGGIQPQLKVDSKGVLHLIYFKGNSMAGDIFYVRREPGANTFSTPLRVNSQPGSAIATGTIRGAQVAIGQGNSVHVAWNGSNSAEPKGAGGTPMLYTRLNPTSRAFEPQRNLITWAGGLDGGGTIAADSKGRVFVAWHGAAAGAGGASMGASGAAPGNHTPLMGNHGAGMGNHVPPHAAPAGKAASSGQHVRPMSTEEADRAVYLARSVNNGRTFAREKKINTQPTGACACCQMRAFVDSRGALYVLYRAASENVNRDSTLLVSRDAGSTFQSAILHKWNIMACPMSSYSLSEHGGALHGAWETRKQIYHAAIQPATVKPMAVKPAAVRFSTPVAAPGVGDNRKHPVMAYNAAGEMLLAWTEGTGWNQGGSLSWQVYNKVGQPTQEKGRTDGVPVWGVLSAVAQPDGGFTLMY